MFPMSTSRSAVSEFDSGMEKLIFLDPLSLRELSKKCLSWDAFPCSFNFPRQRKWVNVIPFLMVERANLLTPSIVDWLGDGRAAGDKRKVPKEIYLTFSTSLLFCSRETHDSCCWIILMSPLLHPSAFNRTPPLWVPLPAGVGIDLLLEEVSAFVKGRPTLFWRLISHMSPRKGNSTLPKSC